MKLLILPLFIIAALTSHAQFAHQNIDLLGTFSDPSVTAEPVYGIKYQACWGWFDSTSGKEYGIIGSTAGTYIVDVSIPSNPIQVDYIPGRRTNCIWHEYKTYGNYLYIISDDGGNNSLQIADMSYLPDSAHVVYDSTDIFVHAHALYIDNDKLYVSSVSTATDFSSMNVYSLTNPEHPDLLRRLDQDFAFINSVHDMYVVNDTVYASCGYDGLFILQYDSMLNQFTLLGALQDASNIYNHSSFLSPDHQTLYLCEEVPDGRPVKVIDVSDIVNPTLTSTFFSHVGATPHNPEVKGNKLFVSYYQDGVYMYDISNPLTPVQLGYFDTYPTNPTGVYPSPAYAGCWSTFSELPSGILLASDMQSGLFCLDISNITGIPTTSENIFSIYPNPASDNIKITGAKNFNLQINDITGRLILSKVIHDNNYAVSIASLNKGLYLLKISDGNKTFCRKIVIK